MEYPGFKYHGIQSWPPSAWCRCATDQDNAFRRQLAEWYTELLGNYPGIELTPVARGCESSRHLFQIQVDHRDEVMAALNSVGIFPGVHYRDNMLYRMFAGGAPCPNAQAAGDRLISLPMHMRLSRLSVERICNSLIQIVEHMQVSQERRKSA